MKNLIITLSLVAAMPAAADSTLPTTGECLVFLEDLNHSGAGLKGAVENLEAANVAFKAGNEVAACDRLRSSVDGAQEMLTKLINCDRADAHGEVAEKVTEIARLQTPKVNELFVNLNDLAVKKGCLHP